MAQHHPEIVVMAIRWRLYVGDEPYIVYKTASGVQVHGSDKTWRTLEALKKHLRSGKPIPWDSVDDMTWGTVTHQEVPVNYPDTDERDW